MVALPRGICNERVQLAAIEEQFGKCFPLCVQVKKLQTWQHLVLGGLSGAMAATATMPLDVTKTALQCGNDNSVRGILSDIVRDKGVSGLFAGMV